WARSCASCRSAFANFCGSCTLRSRERSREPVTAEVSGSTGATVNEISDISETLRCSESMSRWKSLLRTSGRADSWMITSSLVQYSTIAAHEAMQKEHASMSVTGVEIALALRTASPSSRHCGG